MAQLLWHVPKLLKRELLNCQIRTVVEMGESGKLPNVCNALDTIVVGEVIEITI